MFSVSSFLFSFIPHSCLPTPESCFFRSVSFTSIFIIFQAFIQFEHACKTSSSRSRRADSAYLWTSSWPRRGSQSNHENSGEHWKGFPVDAEVHDGSGAFWESRLQGKQRTSRRGWWTEVTELLQISLNTFRFFSKTVNINSFSRSHTGMYECGATRKKDGKYHSRQMRVTQKRDVRLWHASKAFLTTL